MVATDRRRGAAAPEHRLAFIVLDRDTAAADVSRITQRLQRTSALDLEAWAVVERRPDGGLALAAWAPDSTDGLPPSGWDQLLSYVFGGHGELSVSFVDEMRDALHPGAPSLAVVFSTADPLAAIEQLRGPVPGPVVYGVLTDEVLCRATTKRGTADAQRPEPERAATTSLRDHPHGVT